MKNKQKNIDKIQRCGPHSKNEEVKQLGFAASYHIKHVSSMNAVDILDPLAAGDEELKRSNSN